MGLSCPILDGYKYGYKYESSETELCLKSSGVAELAKASFVQP
jgi:hypothetical protein